MATLDPHQIERIAQGLGRISHTLEGLLLRAVELLEVIEEPGNAILVAHAGREIVLGVFEELADEPVDLSPEEEADLTGKKEGHRRKIASALRLSIDHPLVTQWLNLYKAHQANAHYPRRNEPRSPTAVATAFRSLLEHLWAQFAPYFDAQERLYQLSRHATPSEEDLVRLRPLLARPALRRTFFGQLKHPGWLRPLNEAGLLSRPLSPGRDPATVRWGDFAWPEGGYLVHMAKAGADPETVFRALQQIPAATMNPMVWGSAAEAALHLPPPLAAQLVKRLIEALNGPIPFLFPNALLKLAIRLARAGERGAAFRLADALLSVRSRQGPESVEEEETWFRQDAMFRYFRSYDLEGIFDHLIPALAELDAMKALKVLTRIAGLAARAAGASVAGKQDESASWEVDPEEGSNAQSVREGLGPALARLALKIARRNEQDAREVLELLDQEVTVLRKVGLLVLAECGPADQPRLDSAVADEALFGDYRSREEYRRLLQRQFRNASSDAKAIHIQRIREEFPRERWVEHLQFFGNANPTEEEIREAIAHREVELIERLGGCAPDELKDLLGKQRKFLSLRKSEPPIEQASHEAPATLEPFLKASSPDGLEELLHGWTPPPTGAHETIQGIADLLEERVRESPGLYRGLCTVRWTELPPSWVAAVIRGFSTASEPGELFPWGAVLELGSWLVVAQASDFGGREIEAGLLEDARVALLKLIADAAKVNRLPDALIDRALGVVEAARSSFAEASPSLSARAEEPLSYPEGFAAHYLAGQGVRAAVEIALLLIRRRAEGVEALPSADAAVRILSAALDTDGKPGLAARIMFAKRLPWVLLFDSELARTTPRNLFPDGFVPGKEDPAWRAYLRNAIYDSAFEALRSTYTAAVAQISEGTFPNGKARESATERLATHIIWAFIRGAVAVGDENRLIETIFEQVPKDAIGRGYWSIFREFTDAGEKAPPSLVQRVVSLWEWRLDQLESHPLDEHARAEASSLTWLFQVQQLPPERALKLLSRTLAVSGGTGEHVWDRLAETAAVNPRVSLECAERLVRETLESEYPHVNDEAVSAVLRVALAEPTARQQAERLVHRLGEAGFEQFRNLLGDG